MKNIISKAQAFAMAMLLPLTMVLGSCIDNDSFFTANENDDPRILNTDIPDGENGAPGTVTANYDEPFHFEVIVTPADYTTVTWYEDNNEIYTGKVIDKEFSIGNHNLKIVAKTTKGKETYRNMILSINGATLSNDMGARWLYPGAEVTIPGNAISRITKVLINGVEVENVKVADGMLSFKAPELPDGEYEIELVDKDGNTFKDGNVTISTVTTPTINEASVKCKKGDAVELTGIFLNKVKSVKVNGLEVEILYQEFGKLGFTCPLLAVGEYPITATANDGSIVTFAGAESGTLIVKNDEKPAETTIWEGSTTINWGNSNVDIAPELLEGAEGKTICLYYDVPEAEYHAMRICGPWWDGDLVEQFDITDKTPNPYEFEYTAECKGIVDEQGGMLVVGFGYTLTKITIK